MKILEIGDLHFGEKGNSEKFNTQVLNFLSWAVEQAHKHNVDAIVQFGDYYHTRHEINTETLTMGIHGAQLLEASGIDTYALLGNHDLHYLNRLDVSSLNALRRIINIIDEPTMIGDDVYVVPWVNDEFVWQAAVNNHNEAKYLFGHFEFNGFKVNDGYEMEHGLSASELKGYTRVVSGHYHSTQTKGNVTYLGTPFPITMNEANEQHGIFILDTETDEHTFIEYPVMKVVSVPYTRINDVLEMDPDNTSVRIEFPDDLEDETLIGDCTKRLMDAGFSEIKTKYTNKKARTLLESEAVEIAHVDDIDQVVIDHLRAAAEVNGVSNALLEELYVEAKDKGEE